MTNKPALLKLSAAVIAVRSRFRLIQWHF